MYLCCIVRMYTFVCAVQCINTFFILLLFYVGTHLARGYSLGTHGIITSTYSHNTITGNQIYTHTLCGQWQHFFQVVQGCRAGFEPRTSHSSCSAPSLKLPLSHPCTPNYVPYSTYISDTLHLIHYKRINCT